MDFDPHAGATLHNNHLRGIKREKTSKLLERARVLKRAVAILHQYLPRKYIFMGAVPPYVMPHFH